MLRWTESPTFNCYTAPQVITEAFHFAKLANQGLLASPTALVEFQKATGLADFYWEITYRQEAQAKKSLSQILAEVDGLVIFLHGWCGSHYIWEDLPARLVTQYPRLVCLNPDISGFAQSPYAEDFPKIKHTRIDKMMAAVEYWLGALDLFPANALGFQNPNGFRKPFYLFVGHSMGAGMLLYKNQINWQNERYGCYLMSPSMYHRDRLRKFVYRLVAMAMLIPYTKFIRILSSHLVVWLAMNESSQVVKREHTQNFKDSPLNAVSSTMNGIGNSPPSPRTDWSQFKLVMGHRDILVDPRKMLNFAEQLGFKPNQLRVTMGDHYFFSYDKNSPMAHKHNREAVLADLVAFCHELAK